MTPSKGQVLAPAHGFPVDHFGVAVRGTRAGCDVMEALTGVRPYLTPPEPGQWYQSAGLALGPDSFLEIIGPNPDHRGFHPLKAIVRDFEAPFVLFWYVATDDFAAFQARVRKAGHRLERVEATPDDPGPEHSCYIRGVIGPGFTTNRPCVIEWKRKAHRADMQDRCALIDFQLAQPDPAPVKVLFRGLGIDLPVTSGRRRIAFKLDTPKGEVTLESPGINGDLATMLGAAWRDLRRRR